MKVPDGEGVTIHTGPESCVYIRKVMGEALTGDVRARRLSRERLMGSGLNNKQILDMQKHF